MFTLTRTKPDGTTHVTTHEKIRDCGMRMYFWLTDNGYMRKAEATKLAHRAERTGTLRFHDNLWTIEKVGKA